MSGVLLTGHGGTDKLVFRSDIPVPDPGPTDVLIRVEAAGVNNTDINTRKAWYSKGDADAADASWSGASLNFPAFKARTSAGLSFGLVPKRVIGLASAC